jgi:hypothetical protein
VHPLPNPCCRVLIVLTASFEDSLPAQAGTPTVFVTHCCFSTETQDGYCIVHHLRSLLRGRRSIPCQPTSTREGQCLTTAPGAQRRPVAWKHQRYAQTRCAGMPSLAAAQRTIWSVESLSLIIANTRYAVTKILNDMQGQSVPLLLWDRPSSSSMTHKLCLSL